MSPATHHWVCKSVGFNALWETLVNKTIISAIAVGILVLAACGSDDGASGVQAEAAQQALDRADDLGMDLDESCVQDLAKQLSDDDAQAIVDEGTDGDPDLSDEGEALTSDLLNCIGDDALIDLFIAGLGESGDNIDEDCLRDKLADVDLSAALSADDTPTELVTAVIECTDL